MEEGRGEVVRVVAHEGGELGDGDDGDHGEADEGAVAQHQAVEAAARPRHVGDRPHGQEGHLPALDGPVDGEGEAGGDQEEHAHHRAHLEVLLADHLLVDVGGQDVVLAADDLGRPEVGDDHGEDDEGRADEAVAGPGQGDGQEDARGARPERHRRLVEAGVGEPEGGHDDQQGVREGEEDLGDHDPDGAVDRVAEQEPADHALVAEEVDEGDAGQERRHQDGDEGDGLEEALAW